MEFCDLKKQYKAYQTETDAAIQSVLQSAAFINGSEIDLLENELAEYCGAKHAIAVSSGTDALLLSLMAYDLKPGDEVICPAFSFFASASMVSLLKGRPVFVDVSPIDFNIDVSKIEKAITPKTKGIIAVSLFGQCADFDALNELATQYGLWLIEDGAQSFGASYKGRKSCSLTEVATTSFFPAKPLGCYGDGGAVFTQSDHLAGLMKQHRSHGQTARYYHQQIGINGRMDTLQAAVLRVKLKHFDHELKVRRNAAEWYSQKLHGWVMLPMEVEGCESTWAQFTIGLADRDGVRKALAEKGIPTSVHYPLPLPKQIAFSNLPGYDKPFEVAELLSDTVLSLPMHGFISEEEVQYVCDALKECLNETNMP
jgi:UDP-2-acetamido-2-deoxy-ribo-hexuluronate aminotransferase